MSYAYENAKVISVVDGDTLDVEIDYGFRLFQKHRVRLAFINAPEINAPGTEGETSRDWLREKLPTGSSVKLMTYKPKDKYGRFLAEVWLIKDGFPEDMSINELLVQLDLATRY